MAHAFQAEQGVAQAGFNHHAVPQRVAVGDLNVAVKSDHESFHFVLEALNDCQGEHHECHAECHARHGNANHGPSAQGSVALCHAARQQSFHVHGVKGKARVTCRGWDSMLLLDA